MMSQVEDTMKRIEAAERRAEGQAMQQSLSSKNADAKLRAGSAVDLVYQRVQECANFYNSWHETRELLQVLVADDLDPKERSRVTQIRELLIQLNRTLCECHLRLGHVFAECVDEMAEKPVTPVLPNGTRVRSSWRDGRYSGADFLDTVRRSGIDVSGDFITPAEPRPRTAEPPSEEQMDKIEKTLAGEVHVDRVYFVQLERAQKYLVDLLWASEMLRQYIPKMVEKVRATTPQLEKVDSDRIDASMGHVLQLHEDLVQILDAIHRGPDGDKVRQSMAKAVETSSRRNADTVKEIENKSTQSVTARKIDALLAADAFQSQLAILCIAVRDLVTMSSSLVWGVNSSDRPESLRDRAQQVHETIVMVAEVLRESRTLIETRPGVGGDHFSRGREHVREVYKRLSITPPKPDPQPILNDEAEQMMYDGQLLQVLAGSCEEIFLDIQVGYAVLREFCFELDTACCEHDEGSGHYRFVTNSATFMYVFHLDENADQVQIKGAKRPWNQEQTQVEITKLYQPCRLRDLREVLQLITRNEMGNQEDLRGHLIDQVRYHDSLDKQSGDEEPVSEDAETSPVEERPRIDQRRIIRMTETTLREIIGVVAVARAQSQPLNEGEPLGITSVLVESDFKADGFEIELEALPNMQESCGYKLGATGLPYPEPGKDKPAEDGEVTP